MTSHREAEGLPPLFTHELTVELLNQLFDDIAEHGERLEIIVKRWPGTMVGNDACHSLDEARALLDARAVQGIQLRYYFDGKDWWDTLMPLSAGVRLVRVEHAHDKKED